MHRVRRSASILASFSKPLLKKRALNSWTAVHETYLSIKDTFERHKVVFTISTSFASIATAWIGYSLRYIHQEKVEQRLISIEQTLKSKPLIENDELKKIVNPGNSIIVSSIATGGTTLLIGYVLGWRGGRWYANRKFRKEQMKKVAAHANPKWSRFLFFRRASRKHKLTETHISKSGQKDASGFQNYTHPHINSVHIHS